MHTDCVLSVKQTAQGRTALTGRLEICDEISEARSRNEADGFWVSGVLVKDCARPKEEAQPESIIVMSAARTLSRSRP